MYVKDCLKAKLSDTLSESFQTVRSVLMFVAAAYVQFLNKLRWPKKNRI